MSRVAKLVALGVVLAAIAAVAWLLLRSGDPTAFARGKRVELADFKGANPTGVPSSLAQADPVTRGEYLAARGRLRRLPYGTGGQALCGGARL